MVSGIIIFALILCLAASLLCTRHLRLIEYTSNRSRTAFSHILFTILSSLVGGWMFFGLCAVGYEAGVVGYAIGIGYGIGLVILGLCIPRIKNLMQSENCDTMDDFIRARYGKGAQICVTMINLLFFTAILAAQFVALAAFLKIFVEVNSAWLLYSAVVVVLVYATLLGFKGVLLTDVWQFYILSVSAVVIFVFLTLKADWGSIENLNISYFNFHGYGVGFLIGVLFFFPPSLLVRTDLWQRISAARDSRSAQRAFYISAPILLVFYILLTSIGIYGRAALGEGVSPETSGFVHFLAIINDSSGAGYSLFSNIFLSILALGVFSALLSTADTNLNVVSVTLSKVFRSNDWARFESDTPEKIKGNKTELENKLLNTTRVISMMLGIMALGIAKVIPDIVNLMVGAASAIMVFLPAVLMALFKGWRKAPAAISSMLSGFLVLVFMLFVNPKIAFLPATLISFVVYFSVASFTFKKRMEK